MRFRFVRAKCKKVCVERMDFSASVNSFSFSLLFSGGPSRNSRLVDLTDVARTTYTHDAAGNPEDIALGKTLFFEQRFS